MTVDRRRYRPLEWNLKFLFGATGFGALLTDAAAGAVDAHAEQMDGSKRRLLPTLFGFGRLPTGQGQDVHEPAATLSVSGSGGNEAATLDERADVTG